MKSILEPIEIWRHDLTSCLQDSIATALIHAGIEPLPVLGARWNFYYEKGDYRREEYYYPCQDKNNPAESLSAYFPVHTHWNTPKDEQEAWEQLQAKIQEGKPVIVAVDNYYLPFRPAYQDVHTNHLIVVYGIDTEQEIVYVLDNKPPQFKGAIPIETLRQARNSLNPGSDRSLYFYTDNPIENRWLDVVIENFVAEPNEDWVKQVISKNLEAWSASSEDDTWLGIDGIERLLAQLHTRSLLNDPNAMDELYVVGWTIQQQTSLHGDFLIFIGNKLNVLKMAEVGRDVNRLAHAWSNLRMLGAHHRACGSEISNRLEEASLQLVLEYRKVLQKMKSIIS
ncbi:BtrH N-terminal domain-containing protein [Paenibacillus campi]|uniref:BtrH N-terminal domain-containing protein n=1 Tax=Paenibacillus campi TaxID=3106031 RepID=UPI002AFEC885|nr:BtrH N-terminal domain-containing protein [Paenibacillus sp. SGZ-1014]